MLNGGGWISLFLLNSALKFRGLAPQYYLLGNQLSNALWIANPRSQA
jgi:hypothetical protein